MSYRDTKRGLMKVLLRIYIYWSSTDIFCSNCFAFSLFDDPDIRGFDGRRGGRGGSTGRDGGEMVFPSVGVTFLAKLLSRLGLFSEFLHLLTLFSLKKAYILFLFSSKVTRLPLYLSLASFFSAESEVFSNKCVEELKLLVTSSKQWSIYDTVFLLSRIFSRVYWSARRSSCWVFKAWLIRNIVVLILWILVVWMSSK